MKMDSLCHAKKIEVIAGLEIELFRKDRYNKCEDQGIICILNNITLHIISLQG